MLTIDIQKTLPDFNLDIQFSVANETVALLGPSGSGKTTALHAIAGLIQPDSGRIALDQRVLFDAATKVNLRPQARRVGFVFHNYALFPHLTCAENVAFGLSLPNREARTAKTAEVMAQLHISELGNRRPFQVSAGEQLLVALARALATDPEILLLDDPFSALDPTIRVRLENELIAVKPHFKGPVILATRDLAEAYRLSSRIAVIETGGIRQIEEKNELLGRPKHRQTAILTGVRNFFPGELSETRPVCCMVKTMNRTLIAENDGYSFESGQAVLLGIRSEDVQLVPEGGDNVIAGTVTRVTEEIHSFTVIASVIGSPVQIEVTLPKTASIPKTGHHIWMYLPEDRIFLTLP
ncbi:MAG: sulfate/molybdate ABC transporter ATP-binding protein [Solirubrobacterales bacterium]